MKPQPSTLFCTKRSLTGQSTCALHFISFLSPFPKYVPFPLPMVKRACPLYSQCVGVKGTRAGNQLYLTTTPSPYGRVATTDGAVGCLCSLILVSYSPWVSVCS